MNPTVLSDTIQEFEGVRYYLCGRYFQHKGERLHRRVWSAANGEIPDGWHVHHVDEDRANNTLGNLALVPGTVHVSEHSAAPTRAQRAARSVNARKASDGNARLTARQRSAAASEGWANGYQLTTLTCQECGAAFETPFPDRAKFCRPACKQRARRRRQGGEIAG